MIEVFVDLNKAFDIVEHAVLFKKYIFIWYNRIYLEMDQKLFIANRNQYVLRWSKFHIRNIACGVPQGFILGPPLFILYVSDLSFY